ncbi:Masquerade [Operophtera brumata]|uniref:Masquerade n=1 Tax=Operophtera brumata TaxID=104452 RepID=A0A0L7LC76_OPEBR|nr:Masquerade [Operophtera brumata]
MQTLDSQVESKDCPGSCMHPLAALICTNVLEEVECPSNMKCCADDVSAYLTSKSLCVAGRQCCVSRDYGDRERPADLQPTTTPKPRPGRKCRGDCVGGLFSLLCDHIDEDAVCPDEGTCCLTEPKAETTTQYNKQYYTTRRPRPTTTQRPTTTRPPPPMPRCRGYCMLSIMAAFCKPPAILNYHTACNKDSTICCDSSK